MQVPILYSLSERQLWQLAQAMQGQTFKKGDIVFNKMSIRAGALGVVPEDGLITYHYEVMRPYPDTDARYLVYLVKSVWL